MWQTWGSPCSGSSFQGTGSLCYLILKHLLIGPEPPHKKSTCPVGDIKWEDHVRKPCCEEETWNYLERVRRLAMRALSWASWWLQLQPLSCYNLRRVPAVQLPSWARSTHRTMKDDKFVDDVIKFDFLFKIMYVYMFMVYDVIFLYMYA